MEYKAFNGDRNLQIEFEKLIKKHKIKTIVETGTYKGDTTIALAQMVEKVYTIEANKEFFKNASKKLSSLDNVKVLYGNSPKVLRKLLPNIKKTILFFLDAHWERYWPMLDELKEIKLAGNCEKSVIIIHDFYVPGEDLAYDTYLTEKNDMVYWIKTIINFGLFKLGFKHVFPRQKFDYDYIKKGVKAINPDFKHYYNKKAPKTKIGVIFIHP